MNNNENMEISSDEEEEVIHRSEKKRTRKEEQSDFSIEELIRAELKFKDAQRQDTYVVEDNDIILEVVYTEYTESATNIAHVKKVLVRIEKENAGEEDKPIEVWVQVKQFKRLKGYEAKWDAFKKLYNRSKKALENKLRKVTDNGGEIDINALAIKKKRPPCHIAISFKQPIQPTQIDGRIDEIKGKLITIEKVTSNILMQLHHL
jgi:hypothetical protein